MFKTILSVPLYSLRHMVCRIDVELKDCEPALADSFLWFPFWNGQHKTLCLNCSAQAKKVLIHLQNPTMVISIKCPRGVNQGLPHFLVNNTNLKRNFHGDVIWSTQGDETPETFPFLLSIIATFYDTAIVLLRKEDNSMYVEWRITICPFNVLKLCNWDIKELNL